MLKSSQDAFLCISGVKNDGERSNMCLKTLVPEDHGTLRPEWSSKQP